jgi:hypothetical protein
MNNFKSQWTGLIKDICFHAIAAYYVQLRLQYWPAIQNCGCNIGPLFRIAAAKFQDAKFRALPHRAGAIATTTAAIYYLVYT